MAPNQPQSFTEEADPKRVVLGHYFNLQSLLKRVAAATKQSRHQSANAFASGLDDINSIGEYLSSHLEPVYYNERRQPDSAIATRTFLIPEILEIILDHTNFIDIVHMSTTCHGIRNIIYASTKLQVRLYLKPTESREAMQFHSPFVDHRFRRYYFRGYLVDFQTSGFTDPEDEYLAQMYADEGSPATESASDETKLYITFEKADHRIHTREIGKSWKSTIICLPTLKRLKRRPECNCFASQRDVRFEWVESETGFTLNQLLVQAKDAMDDGCIYCKLTKAADQLYDGWEYEMSPSEAEEELDAPFPRVCFEALIEMK